TDEDTAKAITLSASDVEGSPLSYVVGTGPAHGTLSGTAPVLIYTPAANYNGSDSFTFKANDGKLDSNVAMVPIRVNPVNDPPVASSRSEERRVGTERRSTLAANDEEESAASYAAG